LVLFSFRSKIPVEADCINGDDLPFGKRSRTDNLELEVRAIVDTLLALLLVILEPTIVFSLINYNLGTWKDSRDHALSLLYIWEIWVLVSVYFETLRYLVCTLVHH